MINKFQILFFCLGIVFSVLGLNSCSEKDNPVLTSGVMTFDNDTRTLVLDEDNLKAEVSFVSRLNWTITIEQDGSWLSVSPNHGAGGMVSVVFTASNNQTGATRSAKVTFKAAEQIEEFSIIQNASSIEILTPESIKDYDKYYKPQEFSGMDMFRSDSKWSWTRMRQSEHFFVFWDKYFGDDPNGSHLAAGDRVDIDDLLEKAEKFFETNINKLGMSTLGNGTSVLDQYKMEIYLLDPTPEWWVATGSGYDDMIGALWITPSTCQPVGSTIAHEIGHSFQYQTYADRVQTQGAPNDHKSGFRYGFVNLDSGCAYWEQCAQWQAHQDYPEEQFDYANFPVWLDNCHRHFHHEFQRYASYWLQSYWVEKHGVEAYGRIWTESQAPEDAIMTYTRLYNGNDYGKTREELFDYAMKMATFDIAGAREYAGGSQNRYNPNFVKNDNGEYQIAYDNCPGATGFNVIPLTVPANGGEVKVKFRGLGYGETLASADRSNIEDGDGNPKGKPSRYNAAGGSENMGWRYGFVALKGETRTYGSVGKEANGTLSFDVPVGTDYLFLVVQGSPEVYMSHAWDEDETNDPQFPYAITLEGTSLANYEEPVEAVYAESNGVLVGTLNLPVNASDEDWIAGSYDIAEKAVCDFFGLDATSVSNAIVQPIVGEKQTAQEGKIVVFNEEADGSLSDMPTANVGYWLDKQGNAVNWGNNHAVYYEINGSVLTLGKLGSEAGKAGETITMRPVFVYTNGGVSKTLKFIINYNFK